MGNKIGMFSAHQKPYVSLKLDTDKTIQNLGLDPHCFAAKPKKTEENLDNLKATAVDNFRSLNCPDEILDGLELILRCSVINIKYYESDRNSGKIERRTAQKELKHNKWVNEAVTSILKELRKVKDKYIHFSPGGDGYIEAKMDYISYCNEIRENES